jgi:hypothetical protein
VSAFAEKAGTAQNKTVPQPRQKSALRGWSLKKQGLKFNAQSVIDTWT